MKKAYIYTLLIGLFLFANQAVAADLVIRPFLLDETVEARDIITRELTITSEASVRKIVYATVNEITLGGEGEILNFISPSMTDRTNTVTSWVEVSRGRMLIDPGDTLTVPLTLRIHPYAEPGEYHFFLGFVSAANRTQAESIALNGEADGVIVKVVVADPTSESIRIADLDIERFVFNEDDLAFAVKLENVGDAPSVPKGEVIFYNSRNEEVGSVYINEEAAVVGPNETVVFNSKIPFNDKLGRHKANVTVQYGEKGESTAFDTTQFYMIPLWVLIVFILAVVVVSLVITFLIRRVYDEDEFDDIDGSAVPLYVKTGRKFKDVDHDISLKKD